MTQLEPMSLLHLSRRFWSFVGIYKWKPPLISSCELPQLLVFEKNLTRYFQSSVEADGEETRQMMFYHKALRCLPLGFTVAFNKCYFLKKITC